MSPNLTGRILDSPFLKLFKDFKSMQKSGENFKMFFSKSTGPISSKENNNWPDFLIIFHKWSRANVQIFLISQNMATRGQSYFLYLIHR